MNKLRKLFKKRGFTLTEILIAVVILTMVISFGWPAYNRSIERSKAPEAMQILGKIREEQDKKAVQKLSYETNFQNLGMIIEGKANPNSATLRGNNYTYTLKKDGEAYYATATPLSGSRYSYEIKIDYEDGLTCASGADASVFKDLTNCISACRGIKCAAAICGKGTQECCSGSWIEGVCYDCRYEDASKPACNGDLNRDECTKKGGYWKENTCIMCSSPKVWDSVAQECRDCEGDDACDPLCGGMTTGGCCEGMGLLWSEELGTCMGCEDGTFFTDNTCKSCSSVGGTGKGANSQSCNCDSPRTWDTTQKQCLCPDGGYWDAESSSCFAACTAYQQRNPLTKQCECIGLTSTDGTSCCSDPAQKCAAGCPAANTEECNESVDPCTEYAEDGTTCCDENPCGKGCSANPYMSHDLYSGASWLAPYTNYTDGTGPSSPECCNGFSEYWGKAAEGTNGPFSSEEACRKCTDKPAGYDGAWNWQPAEPRQYINGQCSEGRDVGLAVSRNETQTIPRVTFIVKCAALEAYSSFGVEGCIYGGKPVYCRQGYCVGFYSKTHFTPYEALGVSTFVNASNPSSFQQAQITSALEAACEANADCIEVESIEF